MLNILLSTKWAARWIQWHNTSPESPQVQLKHVFPAGARAIKLAQLGYDISIRDRRLRSATQCDF